MIWFKANVGSLLCLVAFMALASSFAHAQGACPATVPVTGNNCYFIAATGADTNSGTNESNPWLHAPGMPNCSNRCAAATPSAGQGFVFRGGDTWHFGDNTSSVYTGGTWAWTWNGSAGNPIYIGVDAAWYSGSSWARPILTGDNPTSTSAVNSCAYRVGAGNVLFSFQGQSNLIFDNFEMTGMCQNTNDPFGQDVYVNDASSNRSLFEHIYAHGWTHTAFNCGGSGLCYGAFIFLGSQGGGQQIGEQYQYNVIDGSDSDPAGWGQFYDGMYDVSFNVIENGSQMIGSLCHQFHDNLVLNWVDPGDGYAHGNVYECVGEAAGNNFYYNNIFGHLYLSGTQGAIFWIGPGSGTTDYFFNSIIYDTPNGGNFFNIQNAGGGPVWAFNSTLQDNANGSVMECQGGASLTHALNMHLITNAGNPFYNGTCATTTNLFQSNSTANGQGYTENETYVYSPASENGGTVGAGTNEQSLCATINGLDSGAGTACQSDTTYTCTYSVNDHTVSCPARSEINRPPNAAWDIGSYQYAAQPAPPTNLVTVVH